MAAPEDPFAREPIEEIPLDPAPLATVLCQVRFPTILEFANEQTVGDVQRRLKGQYPILEREHTVAFLVRPAQGVVPQQQEDAVWRFRSKDRLWQVSLSTNFVALDTKNYASRSDFIERLDEVLRVVNEVGAPPECTRVGLRYVNRLRGEKFLDDIPNWVRCEVVGPHSFVPSKFAELTQSICESQFSLGTDRRAQVRWGRLPPNATVDPSFEAVPDATWILDFDMFSLVAQDFDLAAIRSFAEQFSEYAYRFFRWAVKPTLLAEFGGVVIDAKD